MIGAEMKKKKIIDRRSKRVFVGTRNEACAALFNLLASQSKDIPSKQYYKSLESFYLYSGHGDKKYKATIENIN